MTKTKKKPQSRPPQPAAPAPLSPEPAPLSPEKEKLIQAHRDADEDIRDDPDMQVGGPDDDLDEGELARLDNSNDDD